MDWLWLLPLASGSFQTCYFISIDVNINATTTEQRTRLRKRVQVTVVQRAMGQESNQCMVGQYSWGHGPAIRLRAPHEIRLNTSK